MGDNDNTVTKGSYSCACGFQTGNLADFRRHLLAGKKEPKKHKSLGTKPQQPVGITAKGSKKGGAIAESVAVKPTDNPLEATQLRVVPRSFTMNYTPIMMMAQHAAIAEWGWPESMTLEDFLDTVLYHAFRDRGIILQGYVSLNHNKEVKGGS